ncbi:MAG: hypothetical protein JSV12_00050 [Candidatus Bathyarchaeota archaeon]|nr:MAG: hypothetical protein JSV12_00050 [Candidatus Bathyarchaeota archaeon]
MSIDKEKLKELERRVKKYKKYGKIVWGGIFSILLCILVPIFSFRFAVEAMRLEPPITYLEIVVTLLGFVVWFALLKFIADRASMYDLDDEEWKAFYTNSILDNLEKYFEAKTKGFRKDYRKNALKIAKEFLSCMEKRWEVGSFEPVRTYRDTISNLKKNMKFRVIPYIKDGDDKLLRKIRGIMYTFSFHQLRLEHLDQLNTPMSQDLPPTEQLKAGFSEQCQRYFKAHRILKHSIVVAGFAVTSIVLGYIGMTYVENLSMEGVWVGSITLFGILIGVYFTKQSKGE